ncbi:MAG: hypothetical protein EBS01_12585, partial [Verrucomicrobia bacterium]|nr:hypothetical protein [Verrucomicrobiota bacterium]
MLMRSRGVVAALLLMGVSFQSHAQFSLTSSNYTQNFDLLGTNSTAALPIGWFMASNVSSAFSGTTNTTLAYGTVGAGVVAGNSSGGLINWASGTNATSTDRALGFLNTGTYASGKSIVFGFNNLTGGSITGLDLGWDYEKYRSGTRQWDWSFAYSLNGSTWTTNASGAQSYLADANNTTVSNPPASSAKTVSIGGLSIGNNAIVYLRWTLDGLGGSSNGQGLAIDNFALTALSQALAELFWSGGTWASSGPGTGGAGTWENGAGSWNPDNLAKFQGTGGVVTIGDSAGVTANKGISFEVDGYSLRL